MGFVFEKACAKINICLDITGRRSDGYHEIRSVMQCVTFGDDVSVETTFGDGIILECSDSSLPTDEKNLAFKAALRFFEHIGRSFGVKITIKKNIPDKAGLAGGSADAAAVLRALNELSGEALSDDELRVIAAEIGSDVIFCVSSDPSFVSGRGEIIEETAGLSDCLVLIAKGDDGMKTPEAYSILDDMYGDFSARGNAADICRDALYGGDISKIAEHAFNIFEEVIIPRRPAVGELKNMLSDFGSHLTLMSGSGSAVFGIFMKNERAAAERAVEALFAKGAFAVLTEPME